MRAVAVLHVPDSPFGAVRMGYGRIRAAAVARGDTFDVITPERFPRVARLHGRWHVLLVPFAAAFWLWRRRRDYDVALFHSYAGWVFNLAPGGVPTITAFHGVEPLEFVELDAARRARGARLSLRYRLVHGWMMRQVLRMTCRRSTRVTCLNTEEERYLLDHHWTTRGRLVLLRHGVPNVFFVDHRHHSPRARRLVFVGQWIERKGTRDLVDAFAALARERPDLELWCLGTRTPDRVVLESFPEDVRSRVTVVADATQDALATAYLQSDVFVHPALNEAYGRSIAEAMASALPIIVTPVGVALDLLQDGRDCLVVPKADAPALEAAIRRVLDDPVIRRRLGDGARAAAGTLRADDRDMQVVTLLRQVAAEGAMRPGA